MRYPEPTTDADEFVAGMEAAHKGDDIRNDPRVAVRIWGPPAKRIAVSIANAEDDEFTPQQCRDIARLLNEAADQAERFGSRRHFEVL